MQDSRSQYPGSAPLPWPEQNPRRGLLLFADERPGLGRDAVEAAFHQGGFDVSPSNTPTGAELVIAAWSSGATFRHDRAWRGYLLLPQVRMIVRFTTAGARAEIYMARPLADAFGAALFAGAAIYVTLRAVQAFHTDGPTVLAVAGVFVLLGLFALFAFGRRCFHVLREYRELRRTWEQVCSGADGVPPPQDC